MDCSRFCCCCVSCHFRFISATSARMSVIPRRQSSHMHFCDPACEFYVRLGLANPWWWLSFNPDLPGCLPRLCFWQNMLNRSSLISETFLLVPFAFSVQEEPPWGCDFDLFCLWTTNCERRPPPRSSCWQRCPTRSDPAEVLQGNSLEKHNWMLHVFVSKIDFYKAWLKTQKQTLNKSAWDKNSSMFAVISYLFRTAVGPSLF